MSLKKGAETVILQCLDVSKDDKVVILDDGNDPEILKALTHFLNEQKTEFHIVDYEEPENHGEEPPEFVAEQMKSSDVFIAPTKKSVSHTRARVEACENGSRGSTSPGINQEIWNTSLQADYRNVESITDRVYKILEDTETVRIKTDSGTDLSLKINIDYFHKDDGMIKRPGEFGNLPAGEVDGAPIEVNGKLVVDHLPIDKEAEGTEIFIQDSEVVETVGAEDSKLQENFEEVEGFRHVAEFGFGTNPEAELIGKILQDEKVLGTVHIAFGDNTSYVSKGEHRNQSEIHWDVICKKPTVFFDDEKMLDRGKKVF